MKSYMDLVYTTEGHPRHKLDLFLPANSKEAKYPLIVWMHGGSWNSGDKNLLPPLQYLCPRFAVASLNYRYVSQALFPAQLHDIKTAVRYLKTVAPEYNLDPNRVVLTGFSAGDTWRRWGHSSRASRSWRVTSWVTRMLTVR